MAKKKKQKRPLKASFVAWVAEYNQWRVQFGYPPMVATYGLENLWFAAQQSAQNHGEAFPTWDELTAGARHGPIGNGFSMGSSQWMLLPKGDKGECFLVDKNILKMARWGRAVEPEQTINPKFME